MTSFDYPAAKKAGGTRSLAQERMEAVFAGVPPTVEAVGAIHRRRLDPGASDGRHLLCEPEAVRVNTGPKLTPFHRLKTDPPDRVHRSLLVVDGRLLCSEVRV